MAKVLFINPNKWGRGITHLWIATHSSILKKENHEVELFDCTFYSKWTDDEVGYATQNEMFKPSDYKDFVSFTKNSITNDLQNKINDFKPDIIFWSALSSHIHSEGEYVNIENGYEVLNGINVYNAKKITGGLQVTAAPELVLKKFSNIDCLIMGESEFVLADIAKSIDQNESYLEINGIVYFKDNKIIKNKKQKIIDNLDILSPYDYDIFKDHVFFRPYNGEVVRAVDYELSRGCIYSCSYCVETIIQKYYGFEDNKRGVLKNAKDYIRNKSADRIFEEIIYLRNNLKIDLFRCQDTNFLTINREVLKDLSLKFKSYNENIKLYIETRPEGINDFTVSLLKDLKVDGVGMGLEVSAEGFREESLNRYANQNKIRNAFEMLRKNNIKRTAYNIIGLPNQTEEMILETINFNKELQPDNITVAFYSPYYGTLEQKKSREVGDFDNYEYDVDGQLRSLTKSEHLSNEKLNYYKKNFVDLVYAP